MVACRDNSLPSRKTLTSTSVARYRCTATVAFVSDNGVSAYNVTTGSHGQATSNPASLG